MAGSGGLPMMSAGGLPMTGTGGLPTASTGSLPTTSATGFPMTSAGGLPQTSTGTLPTHAPGGYPAVGGVGAGLPNPGGPGLPTHNASGFPIAGGSGAGLPSHFSMADFPAAAGSGTAMIGPSSPEEDQLAFNLASRPPPGAEHGGAATLDMTSVGGEVDLDGGAPGAKAPLPRQSRRVADAATAEPKKKGRGVKIAGAVLGVIGIAGITTSLIPSVGPFGINFISDRLSADQTDAALQDLRKQTQGELDVDTLTAAVAASGKAKQSQAQHERHKDTAAYAAFVLYMQCIRFGRDGATEAAAKALIDQSDRNSTSVAQLLALAAEDTLAGQLARARQHLDKVQAAQKDDVDAGVLAGEIDLIAKDPNQALSTFTQAVTAHKSARTLYGLARAQMLLGKTAEAEATAKNVLELSANHVGARTMLANIATSQQREAEAVKMLEEVTKNNAVRAGASNAELVEAYVLVGKIQLNASRMTLAQEAFDEALSKNPQSVPALVGRGELFYRSGRFSGAEAAFDSALKADADNIEAKIGTAKTWIALERYKEASDFLAKVQSAHDGDPRVHYWLARVSDALGKRKDAEAFYRAAIEKSKTSETAVPSYVALASLLAATGRPDDAAATLSDASKRFPDSADLARARGDVALQSGNFVEAMSQYEAALKKTPKDLPTLFSLGVTLRRMRRFDEANAVFDKIAAEDPDYPGLTLERGLYFEETGKPDEALKMYDAALQKAPTDVDLKLRIGSTQVAAGAVKQAEPILKDVVRERPNSAEANHFLGRAMLLSASNLNEAIRYLKRAVELDGNRAEYHLYVGWAANQAGDFALAESSLNKAIELDPTLGDAYWQKGVLLMTRGQCVDAIKVLNQALSLRKSRYEAYATLAACYQDQQNATLAEEAWRKAIEGNPTVAGWHFSLGELLRQKNETKTAIVELEKAIELAKDAVPRPGWMDRAHVFLGILYEPTDKEKALGHYKEFMRISLPENAYRKEVEASIARLSN